MICVNLSAKKNVTTDTDKVDLINSLDLILTGWNYDYQFIIDSFLQEKF